VGKAASAPRRGTDALDTFQAALRRLRDRAGKPSFRQMATRAYVNYTTLSRVVQSGRMPTKEAVLAFVRACNGDCALWAKQYQQLCVARRCGRPASFQPWPGAEGSEAQLATKPDDPERIGAAFAAEMRYLWMQSGMTLQEIADQTRHPAVVQASRVKGLSVTTISDLCNPGLGNRLPRRTTVRSFLHAVGATPSEVTSWLIMHQAIASARNDGAEAVALWARALQLTAQRSIEHRSEGQTLRGVVAAKPKAAANASPPARGGVEAPTSAASEALTRLVINSLTSTEAAHREPAVRGDVDSPIRVFNKMVRRENKDRKWWSTASAYVLESALTSLMVQGKWVHTTSPSTSSTRP
jgi:hypothetical protein